MLRTLTRKQLAALLGLGASILVAAALAWTIGRIFKVDPRPAFTAGLLSSFVTVWTKGGRNQWDQLSRGWKTPTLIAAGVSIFVSVALFGIIAVAPPHRSEWLMMASAITLLAGLLLILYSLFSRAMDALWLRMQRHR